MKCGREPEGINVFESGVCPASVEIRLNGTHGGKNGGRACWVIAGHMCHGKLQGTFAKQYGNCFLCDFARLVKKEENRDFIYHRTLLERLSKDD
jgi:hypothetical protein